MAGIDPETLQTLLEAGEGKGGGGQGGGMRGHEGGGGGGGGGEGFDPQTEFDLSQANLATADHFAGRGMGPNTSAALTFSGNQRAARAEAYNNRLKEIETLAKLASSPALEKLGAEGGFEAGYKSPPPQTPESGFNPQGSF